MGEQDNFYISSGITAVIEPYVFLPVTLNTQVHKLLRINMNDNSTEELIKEHNSYPIDFISKMNNKIYMLSSNIEPNKIKVSSIRTYNDSTRDMELCIEKKYDNNNGETIKAFACNDRKLYLITEKIGQSGSNVVLEVYDDKKYEVFKQYILMISLGI